jgi:chromate transporter
MNTLPKTPSNVAGDREVPAVPALRQAFWYWLKLGFISFGGPAGQIAVMHQDLVERKRWISERRFLHALNYCMLLPGPEAQQLATYIGWLMHRNWGGLVAGGLFVLPSLFILVGLSWIYMAFGDRPVIEAALYGVRPAVTAIVLHAALRIGSRSLRNPVMAGLATLSFGAILLGLPFPLIVVMAGLAGIAGHRLVPRYFVLGAAHHVQSGTHLPAIIDDDTPPPAHARRPGRWVRVVLAGLLIWGTAQGALLLAFGQQAVLTQMSLFFTKAALLTFGGAYAVLPYVYQGAVEAQGWLTAAQMMDGLALGESTPGPLIMVVAFVGFVGGWTHALFGADALAQAAIAGACVATFFTFLPSFIFIFAGAPLVEATRNQPHLGAPLSAITAAVVGVILSLALFFARHTFWPQGLGSAFDLAAFAISIAAFLALHRGQVGVLKVIAACAALGVVLKGMG